MTMRSGRLCERGLAQLYALMAQTLMDVDAWLEVWEVKHMHATLQPWQRGGKFLWKQAANSQTEASSACSLQHVCLFLTET